MSEELMITKEDLVNWLNRPPSNDDLDLIGFITTRLENFYKLEQENKQLKEDKKKVREYINNDENYEEGYCDGKLMIYKERLVYELLSILGDKENDYKC